MVDFRSMDLEKYGEPASFELLYEADRFGLESKTVTIQHGEVTLHHARPNKKPKYLTLSQQEIHMLVAGYQQYQQALIDHQAAAKAKEQAVIEEAHALAKNVQFDMADLNIQISREHEHYDVAVPAIGFISPYIASTRLVETVEEALDRIHRDVQYAEQEHWKGHKWPEIVASYRRVFPLEPAEIVKARKLLNEAGLVGWILTHCHTDPTADCWSFLANPDNQDSFALIDKPAAEMLDLVGQYLTNKSARGEPAEIVKARKLLKEHLHATDWAIQTLYPSGKNGTWNFDNGKTDPEEHVSLFEKDPEDMLELIDQYVTEIRYEREETSHAENSRL